MKNSLLFFLCSKRRIFYFPYNKQNPRMFKEKEIHFLFFLSIHNIEKVFVDRYIKTKVKQRNSL